MADTLEKQFQVLEAEDDVSECYHNHVTRHVEELLATASTTDAQLCTISEVAECIRQTRSKKAPGHDRITPKCLKHHPLNSITSQTCSMAV